MKTYMPVGFDETKTYCTLDYVRGEVNKLAEQLAALGKGDGRV